MSLGHLSHIINILCQRRHIQHIDLIFQMRFQRIHMRESEKLAIVNPTLTRTHPTNPNRNSSNIESLSNALFDRQRLSFHTRKKRHRFASIFEIFVSRIVSFSLYRCGTQLRVTHALCVREFFRIFSRMKSSTVIYFSM